MQSAPIVAAPDPAVGCPGRGPALFLTAPFLTAHSLTARGPTAFTARDLTAVTAMAYRGDFTAAAPPRTFGDLATAHPESHRFPLLLYVGFVGTVIARDTAPGPVAPAPSMKQVDACTPRSADIRSWMR